MSTDSPHSEPGADWVRPRDRVIAGVAAGVARRLSWPVLAVRLAFLVLFFFGGLGLVLYLVGWLLIRSEDETTAIASRLASRLAKADGWLGVGLVVVAAVILLAQIPFLNPGLLVAGALLVLGVILYGGGLRTFAPVEASQAPGAPRKEEELPTPPSAVPALPTPRPRRQQSILGRLTLGVSFLAIGVLAVLDVTTRYSFTPRHYVAAVVVVVGLGLVVGAWWGRARWFILVAAAFLPLMAAATVAEAWRDSWVYRQGDTIPERLEGVAGQLWIDLSQVDWQGQTIPIDVSLVVGDILLEVPRRVELSGMASVRAGIIELPNSRPFFGLAPQSRTFDHPGHPDAGAGTVEFDISLDAGSIRIRHVIIDPEDLWEDEYEDVWWESEG